MSESSNKQSHKERVAMRALLRKSGLIPSDATNDEADRWLLRHGYLQSASFGYSKTNVPKNRVARLAHNLGLEVPKD